MISVVMSIYNENIVEIYKSINSILNQSIHNLELIIIDDNPSSIVIKKYLKNIRKKDHRIKIFVNSSNLGPIYSRNKGMRIAGGDYISIMDADDIAFKNKLSFQLQFLKNNNLDIVCSNFSSFNQNGITKEHCFINTTITSQLRIKNIMSYTNIAIGPTIFFKKNILIKLKGYRNILDEDYDFTIRSLVNNYKLGYLSNDLLYKRERKDNLSNNNQLKEFVILSNILCYIRKNNFNKIIPIDYIRLSINEISSNDIQCYKIFNKKYNLFKKHKSFTLFFSMIFIMMSSNLLLQKEIYSFYVLIKKKLKLY